MHTDFSRLFASDTTVLTVIARVSAVGSLIAALEWLSLHRQFRDHGLYSWLVRQTGTGFPFIGASRRWLALIYRYPNILVLIALQACAALAVIGLGHIRTVLVAGCATLAATSMLLSLRGAMGYTGADQLLKINFIAITLALLASSDLAVRSVLYFICGQVILAYATPGILRAQRRSWYDGSSLLLVLRQHTFGTRAIWRLVHEHRWIAAGVSTSLVVFECGFACSLFLPLPGLVAVLVLGVLFHLMTALVMGLNTFVWAFAGTYPAIIWLSLQLGS